MSLLDDENAVLTTNEVADILRCSRWEVCKWRREGLLRSCTPRRRPYCYRVKEIIAFIERYEAAQGAAGVPDNGGPGGKKKERTDAAAV